MEWNDVCMFVCVLYWGVEFVFVTVSCVFGCLMYFFSRLGGCKGKGMVYSRDNDTVRAKQG